MQHNYILVVGGAGFIGSSVIEQLIINNPDQKIKVIGRKTRNVKIKNIEYIKADISNKNLRLSIFKDVKAVIDLTYSTVPKTSFEDPLNDVTSNLPASVNLLQICSQLKIEKYILVSSGGTVYGQAETLTINEKHPTNPISPYGISKLLIEKYGVFFQQMNKLPLIIVRPSNPYGIKQIGMLNQGFIGAVIGSHLSGREISIFGENGSIRDYIYIDDLAKGIVRALIAGQIGRIYNLGTGIGFNNIEVLDHIRSIDKFKNLKINFKSFRDFDVRRNILDCCLAQEELKWSPEVKLKQGIELILEKI